MLKRIMIVSIILILTFGACSCSILRPVEETTTANRYTIAEELLHPNMEADTSSGYGDRMNDGMTASTRVSFSDDLKAGELESLFMTAVFGRNGADGGLKKWSNQINYYVGGEVTDEQLEELNSIIRLMNSADGFVQMKKVESEEEANLVIMYGDPVTLKSIFDWINFKDSYTGSRYKESFDTSEIYYAEIGVSTENTDEAVVPIRRREIARELFSICGISYSSSMYSDSILNDESGIATMPSTSDITLLGLLYNEKIRSGMKEMEALQVLKSILE
ncbi:MAG: DUF2927 domain-containing protein [Clostridiales bacterium]|nr:DUF2927 domain-containing protein [Clostridiales bacterium]